MLSGRGRLLWSLTLRIRHPQGCGARKKPSKWGMTVRRATCTFHATPFWARQHKPLAPRVRSCLQGNCSWAMTRESRVWAMSPRSEVTQSPAKGRHSEPAHAANTRSTAEGNRTSTHVATRGPGGQSVPSSSFQNSPLPELLPPSTTSSLHHSPIAKNKNELLGLGKKYFFVVPYQPATPPSR